MTDRKLRFSRVIWILAAGVGLAQSAVGCAEDGRSSSSTNWLHCDNDADCSAFEGARCRNDDVCVDAKGAPIPADATGGANSGGRTSTGGRANSGGSPAGTGGAEAGGGGEPGNGGKSVMGGEGGGAGSAEPGQGGAIEPGGSGGQSTGAGGGEPGGSGGQSIGAGGSATGGSGGALLCDAGGFGLAAFDRSCENDDDCFVGGHTFNCCGSVRMLGINVGVREEFDAYEESCGKRAICDCAAFEETEDGVRIEKGGTVAECVNNVCRATCVAEGCAFTDDCSADDECRNQSGNCIYIDPNLLINMCRQDDGSCGECP